MKTRAFITTGLLTLSLSITSSHANDLTRMSEGSTISAMASMASATIVRGSIATLARGGELMVIGLQTAGKSTLLTLKSSAEVGEISLRIPTALVGVAAVGVGTTVRALTEATGYTLMASGEVIAFVPNNVGSSLIHHSQREEKK
ncbi:MAG: hypothetical protein FJ147_26735 [Deltaproteobacteria bacterium]|nr:hypothetical protein [Deltaproteobacteria bacterium]